MRRSLGFMGSRATRRPLFLARLAMRTASFLSASSRLAR